MSDVTVADRLANWTRMLFGVPESLVSPDDITAKNYMEATDARQGLTSEGDVYKVAVHVGYNRWRLETKDYDK